ncbi:MAG: hypothetical protein U0166_16290 [Acidobacteriota bacterium]
MDDRHLEEARARIRDNPFYVLGLPTSATQVEVEREGQKLLGMLELSIGSASTYPTPFGPAARTPEKVRLSMAELRDPGKRAIHEVWAQLPPDEIITRPAPPADRLAPWPDALHALGWRR